ncbi:MAG: N-acetylmuramoyl-L-alanine amidase [Lachnospiraceae bacterium]|nr:N-acetylmuramoyl-L-alanine amidase [Lachnospiraceae bacterium]
MIDGNNGPCRKLYGAGLFLSFILFFFCFSMVARAEHVVCIDPGHGGDNLGAEYLGAALPEPLKGVTEKDLTLITSLAMKERLEKYEDVRVVMTRTDDRALSLEERAQIAAASGAEFLFCIHYNASASMRLYGSEVWVSPFGAEYAAGAQFGLIETKALESLGLVDRGVKTKISDKTGLDYYGILKHSREQGVPAAIIEHCHLDNPHDYGFYDTVEKLKRFGEIDADSAAEYLGLKSEALGKDFSGRVLANVPAPINPVSQDRTDPDFCLAELVSEDPASASCVVNISALDSDSRITYYTVSFDNGITESDYVTWPKGKDTFQVKIDVPSGIVPELVITAYNNYDLGTASPMIPLTSVVRKHAGEEEKSSGVSALGDSDGGDPSAGQEEGWQEEGIEGENSDSPIPYEETEAQKGYSRWAPEREALPIEEDHFFYFLEVSLVAVAILFGLFLTTLLFTALTSGGRRKQNRKQRYRA